MTITIRATYENGVLRLPHPLDLPEHTLVEVQVQRACEHGQLTPAQFSNAERARRAQIVQRLRGLWSEREEAAFGETRQELWAQWQPHSLV
jgi:predicted DNA-binding antitoxin AbrB/MazE fold protein